MARQEANREDLLREATALVERVELRLPQAAVVVAGFRSNGAASFYFSGGDPAYHFTSVGELRRAFAAGRLLKAERGKLVSLFRQRTETEVQLIRNTLSACETEEILAEATKQLQYLRQNLLSGTYRNEGQVPAERDLVGRIQQWIEKYGNSVAVADKPSLA